MRNYVTELINLVLTLSEEPDAAWLEKKCRLVALATLAEQQEAEEWAQK